MTVAIEKVIESSDILDYTLGLILSMVLGRENREHTRIRVSQVGRLRGLTFALNGLCQTLQCNSLQACCSLLFNQRKVLSSVRRIRNGSSCHALHNNTTHIAIARNRLTHTQTRVFNDCDTLLIRSSGMDIFASCFYLSYLVAFADCNAAY